MILNIDICGVALPAATIRSPDELELEAELSFFFAGRVGISNDVLDLLLLLSAAPGGAGGCGGGFCP